MSMFTSICREAMSAHALAEFPRESCGLVVRGRYVRCTNIANNPFRNFEIAPDAWLKYDGKIDAVVHSHPYDRSLPEVERIMPWPTKADMQGQDATAVAWVIIPTDGVATAEPVVWGGKTPISPLIGREFIHGVTDCYALVRDYYSTTHGILLPSVPRDDAWWEHGENLYLDNLTRAGFVAITEAEALPGDGFIAQVRSDVPNHAGVLVDGFLILHHLQGRLSRRDPVGLWSKHIVAWLRHKDVTHG